MIEINRDWLYEQYTINEKSTVDIAKKLKCSINTINRKLRQYNILVRRHHTNKTKQKIGKAGIGRKVSKETVQKIQNSRKGYSHSIATRTKQSITMTGRKASLKTRKKMSDMQKGKNHPLYGKKHSEETKQRMSKIAKKRFANGFKIWNWTGKQKSYGIEFNGILKKKIRNRDNRICQMPNCGKTEEENGYKLDVHHIDYDKENNLPENLISLCMSCHGKTQINKNNWITCFSNILNILGEIIHG